MDTKSGHLGSDPFAWLLHAKELRYDFPQGFRAISPINSCVTLTHPMAQNIGHSNCIAN